MVNALEELHYALETMQTNFFELWLGTWPESIDWTGAVLGTLVSASLYSLTRSLEYALPPSAQSKILSQESQKVDNEINKYFSQSVAYYFGENALEIRFEAFDDMLWVVLGWLENIRFIKLHTEAHYSDERAADTKSSSWYGEQFLPAFAHRAHVFYDLARNGWGTELCGGGMTWNPYLIPYKNAITNELFISASIGMYLYFPGDLNRSPFMNNHEQTDPRLNANPVVNTLPLNKNPKTKTLPPARAHDPAFLKAAVDAYDWLSHSGMTNAQGLYTDGFHIRNYGVNGTKGTRKCDVRNEMVYTYNQGVLLSGLRGLWESTGRVSYLEDGHRLVRSVLGATGWDAARSLPDAAKKGRWSGLGRDGVLEELCDADGTCSQNGQTFKGIFFHHLTLFCEPLPTQPLIPGVSFGAGKDEESLHRASCKSYAPWVAHNAVSAMATRDEKGRFGMWWGAPDNGEREVETPLVPRGAVDYRNCNITGEALERWGPQFYLHCLVGGRSAETERDVRSDGDVAGFGEEQKFLYRRKDANDRGRGRTVETQGGGLAVVRAMWEFVNMYGKE